MTKTKDPIKSKNINTFDLSLIKSKHDKNKIILNKALKVFDLSP